MEGARQPSQMLAIRRLLRLGLPDTFMSVAFDGYVIAEFNFKLHGVNLTIVISRTPLFSAIILKLKTSQLKQI